MWVGVHTRRICCLGSVLGEEALGETTHVLRGRMLGALRMAPMTVATIIKMGPRGGRKAPLALPARGCAACALVRALGRIAFALRVTLSCLSPLGLAA